MQKAFAKTTKTSKALFIQRLTLMLSESKTSMRAFSAQLGISHASLSRMISGEIAISTSTVALICGKLSQEQVAPLIEAYLRDQLQDITRGLVRRHPWARGRVVTIRLEAQKPGQIDGT
jgi:DNA-binding Xre family transcriptional regulator